MVAVGLLSGERPQSISVSGHPQARCVITRLAHNRMGVPVVLPVCQVANPENGFGDVDRPVQIKSSEEKFRPFLMTHLCAVPKQQRGYMAHSFVIERNLFVERCRQSSPSVICHAWLFSFLFPPPFL